MFINATGSDDEELTNNDGIGKRLIKLEIPAGKGIETGTSKRNKASPHNAKNMVFGNLSMAKKRTDITTITSNAAEKLI